MTLFALAFYYGIIVIMVAILKTKWLSLLSNAISCVDKKTSHPTERAQHCGIVFKILYDIIFSLGNMKLFVSFFHITAVKRCHSQIMLNTNCTPTFMDS
jgi:hypothetical protein